MKAPKTETEVLLHTNNGKKPVMALVRGPLALHLSIEQWAKGVWTITQTRTGLALLKGESLEKAMSLFDTLETFDQEIAKFKEIEPKTSPKLHAILMLYGVYSPVKKAE